MLGKKPCRNTKLQLNFKAKEYYMITTNAGEECEVLGTKFPKLDKPRISKIVDGAKLIDAENQAFRTVFARVTAKYDVPPPSLGKWYKQSLAEWLG